MMLPCTGRFRADLAFPLVTSMEVTPPGGVCPLRRMTFFTRAMLRTCRGVVGSDGKTCVQDPKSDHSRRSNGLTYPW